MSINVDNDIFVLIILTRRIKEIDIFWVFQNWFFIFNISRNFIRKIKVKKTSIITFIVVFDVILLKTLNLCCKVDRRLNNSCNDDCCNDCLNSRIKLILILLLIRHDRVNELCVNDFLDRSITSIDRIKIRRKIEWCVWCDNWWIVECYRRECEIENLNFRHAVASKSSWRENIKRYWWNWRNWRF